MTEALHEKYVPILRFAEGERFFPVAVDDFVRYSTVRAKGKSQPLVPVGQVTPSLLARAHQNKPDVYLQSIPAPLANLNVADLWGKDVLQTLADATAKASRWQQELARVAYRWFSAKTESATKLFWWNDLVMNLVDKGKRSERDLPRLMLPPEIRQAAVQNYERSQPARPNYAYYHRLARDRDYLCLQYWFFYSYNDWATGYGGMNDHEGDWEGMYVFFKLGSSGNPVEPPGYITFVGHHSRLTKPWGHADVTLEGTHPVAFVAAGSHATYPERKQYDLMAVYGLVDHATGDGVVIQPDDWKRRVDLSTEPWTSAFLGGWGTRYWLPVSWIRGILGALSIETDEIVLPGVSAPRGPRFGDDGRVRPNWIDPVAWAGIPELEAGIGA